MNNKKLVRHEFCNECYWYDEKDIDCCMCIYWDIAPKEKCAYFLENFKIKRSVEK